MQILEEILTNQFGPGIKVKAVTNLSGGCVSHVFKLVTNRDDYCIKTGKTEQLEIFQTESEGLSLLAEKSNFRLPRVFGAGIWKSVSYLLMEYVDTTRLDQKGWINAGNALAVLHQNTMERFGLDTNNFIAGLVQDNSTMSNWSDFFIHQRLEPQIKLAYENQLIEKSVMDKFEISFSRISSIFPEEPPALLHGDLWSGNIAADASGHPFIYDPAVYFGHREIELSFTRLFGGFPHNFYAAYNSIYPVKEDFEERVDIYNLYPLLVHLNLFGISYLESIIRIIKRLQ